MSQHTAKRDGFVRQLQPPGTCTVLQSGGGINPAGQEIPARNVKIAASAHIKGGQTDL